MNGQWIIQTMGIWNRSQFKWRLNYGSDTFTVFISVLESPALSCVCKTPREPNSSEGVGQWESTILMLISSEFQSEKGRRTRWQPRYGKLVEWPKGTAEFGEALLRISLTGRKAEPDRVQEWMGPGVYIPEVTSLGSLTRKYLRPGKLWVTRTSHGWMNITLGHIPLPMNQARVMYSDTRWFGRSGAPLWCYINNQANSSGCYGK